MMDYRPQQPARKNVRQTVEHVCGLLHAVIPAKTALTPEHIRKAKFNDPSASPFLLQALLDLSRLNPNNIVLAQRPVTAQSSNSSRSGSSSTRSSYAGSSSSDKETENRNRRLVAKPLTATQDRTVKPDKVSALILAVKNGRVHSEKPAPPDSRSNKPKRNPNSNPPGPVQTRSNPNPNPNAIERQRGKGENPHAAFGSSQRNLPGNETLAVSRPSSRSKSARRAENAEPQRNTLRNLNLSTAPYDDSVRITTNLAGRSRSRSDVDPALRLLQGGSKSSKQRENKSGTRNREIALVQTIRELAGVQQKPTSRVANFKFLQDTPKEVEMKLESVKLSLSKWGYPDEAPIFALTNKNLQSRPILLALGWTLSYFNLFEQVLSCRVETLLQVRSRTPLPPYPADLSCTDDALTVGREAEASSQAYMKKITVSLDGISDAKARSAARAQQVLLMYGKVIHCMKGLVSLKQSKEQLVHELDELQQQKKVSHPFHNRVLSQYEVHLLQHKEVFIRHAHSLQAEKMLMEKINDSKCHLNLFEEWMESVMAMNIADSGECDDEFNREFFFYNGKGCIGVSGSGKTFTNAETTLQKIRSNQCCKQETVKPYIVEDEIERFKVLEARLHRYLAHTQAV